MLNLTFLKSGGATTKSVKQFSKQLNISILIFFPYLSKTFFGCCFFFSFLKCTAKFLNIHTLYIIYYFCFCFLSINSFVHCTDYVFDYNVKYNF